MLSAAIDTLAPGMRKTIELRELEELSIKETARCMGLSVGAVKSRVLRSRMKIREALRRYLGSPRMHKQVATRGHLARSPRLRRMSLRVARKEALIATLLLLAVLAIVGFL